MCVTACFQLYEPGKPLQEITCPCGHGYWDIFSETFVTGDRVRSGHAPSKQEYEAKVKDRMSPDEYEAKLREQWIRHFGSCPTHLKTGRAAAQQGRRNRDCSSRAQTDLEQIRRGDFVSKGRTNVISDPRREFAATVWPEDQDRPTPRDVRPEDASSPQSRYHAESHSPSRSIRTEASRSIVPDPGPVLDRGQRIATRDVSYSSSPSLSYATLFDRLAIDPNARQPLEAHDELEGSEETRRHYESRGREAQDSRSQGSRQAEQPNRQETTRTAQGRSNTLQDYFLPGDGIHPRAMEYRLKPFLGDSSSFKPYTTKDGRQGYLITASRALTTDNIAQIKQDSIKIDEALRQRPELERRPSAQRERGSDNVRPDLGVARRHPRGRQYNVGTEHGVTIPTSNTRSARDVYRDTWNDSHSVSARDTRDLSSITPTNSTINVNTANISFDDRRRSAQRDSQSDSDDENRDQRTLFFRDR